MASGPFRVLKYYLENFHNLSTVLHGTESLYAATVGPFNESSVIFLSPRMTTFMNNCKEVFTSFQTIHAAHRKQDTLLLYQVSCLSDGNSVTSLMQAFIQTPTYEAIRAILLYLKEAVPAFRPLIVNLRHCKREQAAWEEVFMCQINFTYTSYSNALLKTIAKLQLTNAMELNSDIRNLLSSFLAIPFLPRSMMRVGTYSLVKRSIKLGHFNRLEPFFNYFISTWIEGDAFESLSDYNQGQVVNNAQEVAVQNLTTVLGSSYPDILHVIRAIRQYEWLTFSSSLVGSKVASAPCRLIANSTYKLSAGTISIKRFLHKTSLVLMECLF